MTDAEIYDAIERTYPAVIIVGGSTYRFHTIEQAAAFKAVMELD